MTETHSQRIARDERNERLFRRPPPRPDASRGGADDAAPERRNREDGRATDSGGSDAAAARPVAADAGGGERSAARGVAEISHGRTGNSSGRRTPRRRKPVRDLKVNSRAALWASSELGRDGDGHDGPCKNLSGRREPVVTSQARSKEAWATARAGWTKAGDHCRAQRGPKESCILGAIAAIKLADEENPYPSVKKKMNDKTCHGPSTAATIRSHKQPGYSFCPDRTCTYGQSGAIRKEWEKIDGDRTPSPMEEAMEGLLSSLDDADVGALSSTPAPGPPDRGGGAPVVTGEGNLSDVADEVMRSWATHVGWTAREARLAGRILLRMERGEVLAGGAPVPRDAYLSVINAYAKCTSEDET